MTQSIRHRRAARIKPGGGRVVGPAMRRAWEAMGPDLVTAQTLAERCGERLRWAQVKLMRLEEHALARPVGIVGDRNRVLWRRMGRL